MTHVMVVPADRGGCGYYRLIWPAQAVAIERPDWTVSVVAPEKVQAGMRGGVLDRVVGFPDPMPDLLVVQRVGTRASFEILRWAQAQGVATVVDFDDAMWAIDRSNSAWRAWNGGGQDWRLCDEAVKYADLVTCTTEHLARRYAKHGRVEVIPNSVPLAAVDLDVPERPDEPFHAGWAGFTNTHPGDCQVSAPAAQAVLDAGGRLRVVADAAGAETAWGLPEGTVDRVPSQRLGPDYYRALGLLDLMLVGLRDTQFNRSKSTLKVLEAGSQSVPSIAADTPPHRALQRSGFPLHLAASPAEWAATAHLLATEGPEAHGERRSAVWEHTRAHHTIEGNAHLWAAAWERAMARASR